MRILWQPGPNPADSESDGEQGFIDLTADAQGTIHAVWLDKRDEKRGLRYSRSLNGGIDWKPNRTIDDQTCECCWNRIRSNGDSLFVSYRDTNPRDMHVTASHDNGLDWSQNLSAGQFDWQFEGCPHTGAGLATGKMTTSGNTVHLTTWTGKGEIAGLYYTHSADAGISWRKPVLIAGVKAKHSDVAAKDEHIIAVWDKFDRQGSTIFMTESFNNGEQFRNPVPLHCVDQSAGSHPRIVEIQDKFIVLWTTEKGNLCAVILR